MSQKFNGFSQDEINKVSGGTKGRGNQGQSTEATKQAFRGQHGGIRRMPEKWSRPTETFQKQEGITESAQSLPSLSAASTGRSSANSKVNSEKADALTDMNLEQSMSKSLEEALFYQPASMKKPMRQTNGHEMVNGAISTRAEISDSSILQLPTMDSNVSSTTAADDSSILPTQKSDFTPTTPEVLKVESPFKGISLREFETHRKMIQEQNKQKKELLYKAIEHHSQKTAAEARKIAEIKQELAKLDNDLALDVSILRKQIDNACIHFAQVEKQYMKIEAQFLKAKIDLHNAAEKKELLTEHLCTVIAHNEDRKAQKLSELMEKVGLTQTGEYDTPDKPHTMTVENKE